MGNFSLARLTAFLYDRVERKLKGGSAAACLFYPRPDWTAPFLFLMVRMVRVNMMTIKLSNGEICFVDETDLYNLSKYKWRIRKGYACRNERKFGVNKIIMMHRKL